MAATRLTEARANRVAYRALSAWLTHAQRLIESAQRTGDHEAVPTPLSRSAENFVCGAFVAEHGTERWHGLSHSQVARLVTGLRSEARARINALHAARTPWVLEYARRLGAR